MKDVLLYENTFAIVMMTALCIVAYLSRDKDQ
jgi:hypothetical protein